MPQHPALRVPRDPNPLQVTEMVLRFPRPFSAGLVVNRPASGMSHAARLFQARMWRGYVRQWDSPEGSLQRGWVEDVLRHNRADCLRRVRINLYLARRLRRTYP